MSVDFLVFKVTWVSQGCRDLRGHQGQWASREIWVNLGLLGLKELGVLLVCQASREIQDFQVSMGTMAHQACQVSQDAMGLREKEEEMAPLVFMAFKDLLASLESKE